MPPLHRLVTTPRYADVVTHGDTAYWVEVADDTSLDARGQIGQVLAQIDATLVHDRQRSHPPPPDRHPPRRPDRRGHPRRTLGRLGAPGASPRPGSGSIGARGNVPGRDARDRSNHPAVAPTRHPGRFFLSAPTIGVVAGLLGRPGHVAEADRRRHVDDGGDRALLQRRVVRQGMRSQRPAVTSPPSPRAPQDRPSSALPSAHRAPRPSAGRRSLS